MQTSKTWPVLGCHYFILWSEQLTLNLMLIQKNNRFVKVQNFTISTQRSGQLASSFDLFKNMPKESATTKIKTTAPSPIIGTIPMEDHSLQPLFRNSRYLLWRKSDTSNLNAYKYSSLNVLTPSANILKLSNIMFSSIIYGYSLKMKS